VPLLGELLLDAYRGTIDDEGETLKRAIAEMQGYFDGKYGRALPEASAVAWRGPVPVSLSLVSWFAPTDCPFISYVATRSDSKGVGVGRLVLCESLRRLGRNGYGQVRAFITKGNAPSEALFKGRGFAPVANPP
jgi:hypothetical protein